MARVQLQYGTFKGEKNGDVWDVHVKAAYKVVSILSFLNVDRGVWSTCTDDILMSCHQ
jgi:hypothetical protein